MNTRTIVGNAQEYKHNWTTKRTYTNKDTSS